MTHRDGNITVSDLASETVDSNRSERAWTLSDLLKAALEIDDAPISPPAKRSTLRIIEGGKRSE